MEISIEGKRKGELVGEEVWEGSQCLGIVCPWSHFPRCLRITYITHHITSPSSKFDALISLGTTHVQRPSLKNLPHFRLEMIGCQWWVKWLLTWFCSGEVDSKALIESKKVRVYTAECGALHFSEAKATFQESSEVSTAPSQLCSWLSLLPPRPDTSVLKLRDTCSVSFFCNHSSLLLQAKRGSDPHLQHGAWAEHKRTFLCTLTWVITLS